MKAALLESAGRVIMTDAPMPVIENPDQMLIQVKAVGICGSEIHAFDGTHPFRKAPVVMGHEMSGVVTAVGSEVKDFKAGDRVVVDPQWMCGQCPSCLEGDYNACPSKFNMGTPRWPGAFGEFIHAPEKLTHHLPDNLSFIDGALVEPLSIAVHVARRLRLESVRSIAILGTGSIGGMLTGVSKAKGVSTIIGMDIRQHCLDASIQMGASHTFLLPDADVVTKISEITSGNGVDVVAICADDTDLIKLAIQIARPRGKIALIALMTDSPLAFAAYDVIRKEIEMVGCYQGNRHDYQESIELTKNHQINTRGIVTHVLPIEQAQKGCELTSTKLDCAIKVILTHQ
jgi:L-iditol 2-dehydrogenase